MAERLVAVANNFTWIFSVASVMASGDLARDGMLEPRRLKKVLDPLHINITADELFQVGVATKTESRVEESKGIKRYVQVYPMLKLVRDMLAEPRDDESLRREEEEEILFVREDEEEMRSPPPATPHPEEKKEDAGE